MTMLDMTTLPQKTIGRPHFGKDTNYLAAPTKPQNKVAAVASEKEPVNRAVLKPVGLTFTTALRSGDKFIMYDDMTLIVTVLTVAFDKRGGAWIITNAPTLRSFHSLNIETVMLCRIEDVSVKPVTVEPINYNNEPEMIPGLMDSNQLRRHDKVFVSGVGIRAVGAVTAKSAFCEKGYTLRFEEMPQVIVVHRGDPNEVLRPPTIRSAVGSWPTGDVFQRTGSEPKCPAGQSPAGDGTPADNTPRPKLVQPVPGTQVIIFPGSNDTYEAIQQSRVSAAVAEKSASLTDELNRDLYERVQAKRAARQAAQ